jgi:hypothetical protein
MKHSRLGVVHVPCRRMSAELAQGLPAEGVRLAQPETLIIMVGLTASPVPLLPAAHAASGKAWLFGHQREGPTFYRGSRTTCGVRR